MKVVYDGEKGKEMKERNKRFGEALKERRQELGLSGRGLAGILGVTHVAVRKWELGESTPSVHNIMELEQQLDMDFFQYYRNKGDKD